MNPFLKALHGQLAALHAEGQALMAADSHSETQTERLAALPGLIAAKEQEISKAADLTKALGSSETFLNGSASNMQSLASQLDLSKRNYAGDEKGYEQLTRMHAPTRFFSLCSSSPAEAQKKAFRFGMFARAALLKDPVAQRFCKENGIPIMFDRDGKDVFAVQGEGDNAAGGALVVPEFENDMIILRETFGLIRKLARYTPMMSDTKSRPRRVGGLVAYHVGSQQAAAESNAKWDRVNLTAKKVMVISRFESELGEDATVDFGDTLAGEMAYAFTVREDQDGFIGDGTSNYGGIVGIINALVNVYTTGGGVGLVQGTAPSGSFTHWTALTLTDFAKMKGQLPEYAEKQGNIKWTCHKAFFEEVMAPIALSAGGVTAAEIVNGVRRRFMGYDVEISQVMPNSPAANQVPCVFGAIELGVMFGDRRRTTIAFSEHAQFTADEIVARGTERYDINVHDVGSSTTPGPIVGIVTQ